MCHGLESDPLTTEQNSPRFQAVLDGRLTTFPAFALLDVVVAVRMDGCSHVKQCHTKCVFESSSSNWKYSLVLGNDVKQIRFPSRGAR